MEPDLAEDVDFEKLESWWPQIHIRDVLTPVAELPKKQKLGRPIKRIT
jgi:hypothetical protein